MTVLSPQPCYDYSSVSTVKFTICTVDSTSGDFSVMYVVLESMVLVSRCLEDKNESFGFGVES